MFSRLLKFLTCMSLCVSIVFFCFSGCQDLGEDVKTEEDYYSLFPTVYMLGIEGIDSADMEDLYNKETSENLTSPFDLEKEYQMMIITVNPPHGKVLTCDSVAMFLLYSGDVDAPLVAECYIADDNLFQLLTVEKQPLDEEKEPLYGRANVTLKAIINKSNAKQPQNSFVLNFTRSEFNTTGYIIIIFKRTSVAEVAFRPTNVMIHTNSLKDGE